MNSNYNKKKKTIAIGDIHGRDIWKEIVNREDGNVVFIGDYFDSLDVPVMTQLENFYDICQYKRDNPDKVVMLIGNHDWHYLPYIKSTGTSGFKPHMYATFSKALEDNHDLIQMAYRCDSGVVYSHAGISKEFLTYNDIDVDVSGVAEAVNDLFKYKPNAFEYFPGDRSGYGNHVRQSCTWIRPDALYKARIDAIQVVGHTQVVGNINPVPKSIRRGFFLIDCLHNKQYLTIDETNFEIKRLE